MKDDRPGAVALTHIHKDEKCLNTGHTVELLNGTRNGRPRLIAFIPCTVRRLNPTTTLSCSKCSL